MKALTEQYYIAQSQLVPAVKHNMKMTRSVAPPCQMLEKTGK